MVNEYVVLRNFSKQPFFPNERGRNIPVLTFGRKTIYQMNCARTRAVPLIADTCLLRLIWAAKGRRLDTSMLLRVRFQSGKMFEVSIPIPIRVLKRIYETHEELEKRVGRKKRADFRGGYTEIYMTPQQEKELDEAIAKIRAEKERKKLLKSQQSLYTQTPSK